MIIDRKLKYVSSPKGFYKVDIDGSGGTEGSIPSLKSSREDDIKEYIAFLLEIIEAMNQIREERKLDIETEEKKFPESLITDGC